MQRHIQEMTQMANRPFSSCTLELDTRRGEQKVISREQHFQRSSGRRKQVRNWSFSVLSCYFVWTQNSCVLVELLRHVKTADIQFYRIPQHISNLQIILTANWWKKELPLTMCFSAYDLDNKVLLWFSLGCCLHSFSISFAKIWCFLTQCRATDVLWHPEVLQEISRVSRKMLEIFKNFTRRNW